MSSRFRIRLAAAAAVAAFLAALTACARREPPPAAEPLPALPLGVTQVSFLPDPSVKPPVLPPGEEILPAAPSLIPAPLYPQEALAAGCGDATIVLRIVVDEQGRVSEVKDSPVAGRAEGPCTERFRAEAEAALRGWRFRPAEWRRLVPGADMDGDGTPDYHRVTAFQPIPVFLDVRVDYEVIAGEGRVRLRA